MGISCVAIATGTDEWIPAFAGMTWIETAKELNKPIPKPGELESQSGKWVQRKRIGDNDMENI